MSIQALLENSYSLSDVVSHHVLAENHPLFRTANSIDPEFATLKLSCEYNDRIFSTLTNFIRNNGGHISDLQHHVDAPDRWLFMRVDWDLSGFRIPTSSLHTSIADIAEKFDMQWHLHYSNHVPRMAVFVSKESHCLYEIISRIHSGEWSVELPVIISNHPDLRWIAELNGINYHMLPISKANKAAQEEKIQALLEAYDVDFVVLARYMQILSEAFVKNFTNKIINIHHSLLPAFPGGRPYHAAYSRGVKLIGATSHYVTDQLDAGPIIEQDVLRVNHFHSINDLIRQGRDLERLVLARAIAKHTQHKIMVTNNRTVVFQ